MQIQAFDRYERAKISPPVLQLLCDFAAADLQRPLHRGEIDWQEVLNGVARNGLLGLTYYYLSHQTESDYPPPAFRQGIQQAYRLTALRMALIYRHVLDLLVKLNQSGVEYLIIKGPAVAYSVYPDPAVRIFNDLDVVIRERDWGRMYCFLTAAGFESEEKLPAPPPQVSPQLVPYESKYVHPANGFRVEIHYEDFLNAGLRSRDVDGFWTRSQTVDVKGIPIRILSLEDQLIHLCAHAHYHGYTRLNWFSDLALIVRDQKINWPRLLETVNVEDVRVPVYYTLYFLGQVLDVHAPAAVLESLTPDRFRRRLHERYMPEADILSFQPMRRPDFSFYFVPLIKRLLPDLLVMGRRREKLGCLARLLLPPRAWLRSYYNLDERQPVTPHYLLHPLKFLVHYLRELVLALINPDAIWSE